MLPCRLLPLLLLLALPLCSLTQEPPQDQRHDRHFHIQLSSKERQQVRNAQLRQLANDVAAAASSPSSASSFFTDSNDVSDDDVIAEVEIPESALDELGVSASEFFKELERAGLKQSTVGAFVMSEAEIAWRNAGAFSEELATDSQQQQQQEHFDERIVGAELEFDGFSEADFIDGDEDSNDHDRVFLEEPLDTSAEQFRVEGSSEGDVDSLAESAWQMQQSGDFDGAWDLWVQAAEKGSLEAHLVIAFHYHTREASRFGLGSASNFPFQSRQASSSIERCEAAFPHYRAAADAVIRDILEDGAREVVETHFLEDEWLFETPSIAPEEEADELEFLRQLAEAGDAAAANDLGNAYAMGIWGVGANHTEAIKFFRQSARQGDSEGLANLGWLYLSGHTDADLQPSDSLKNLDLQASTEAPTAPTPSEIPDGTGRAQTLHHHDSEKLSQTDSVPSNSNDNGEGGPRLSAIHERQRKAQPHRALRMLKMAAAKGNTHAQANLGFLYMGAHQASGIPTNQTLARLYLQDSASVKNLENSFDLEFTQPLRDVSRASQFESKGILLDDLTEEFFDQIYSAEPNTDALLTLGEMVAHGIGGAIRNASKAVQLYEISAKYGSIPAHHHMAVVHWSGAYGPLLGRSSIIRRNCREAVRYMRTAALTNRIVDELSLQAYNALTSEEKPDYMEAVRLYQRLANLGDESAAANLGFLFATGWPQDSVMSTVARMFGFEGLQGDDWSIATSPAESLKWSRVAAEQGERHSAVRIGDFYYDASLSKSAGLQRNITRAYLHWHRAAREWNDSKALYNIATGVILKETTSETPAEQLLQRSLKWNPNAWLAVAPWAIWQAIPSFEGVGSKIGRATVSDSLIIGALFGVLGILAFIRQCLRGR